MSFRDDLQQIQRDVMKTPNKKKKKKDEKDETKD